MPTPYIFLLLSVRHANDVGLHLLYGSDVLLLRAQREFRLANLHRFPRRRLPSVHPGVGDRAGSSVQEVHSSVPVPSVVV